MRFPGVAQLSNGESTELELDLSPTRVEIYVGDELVEVWATHDCRIVSEGEGRFRIESADESFLFLPLDPAAFQISASPGDVSVTDRIKALAEGEPSEMTNEWSAVESGAPAPDHHTPPAHDLTAESHDRPEPHDRPDAETAREAETDGEAGPVEKPDPEPEPLRLEDHGHVAEPIGLASGGADEPPGAVDVRSVPPAPPRADAARNLPADFVAPASAGTSGRPLLPVILAVVGTIVVVVIVLIIVSAFFGETEDSSGAVAVTQAPLPEPLPGGQVFDGPPAGFVQEWNRVAGELAEVLEVDGASNGEAPLSAFARLEWSSENGLLSRYQVVIDPTGPPDADQEGLAALGVAIAVADPSLDGPARRDVLSSLGLDVSDPDLAGIDAETEVNGVRYGLRYLPSFQTLLFGVSPAG